MIASQAMKTKQPVVEECDAGLIKIAVPVFVSNAFMGVVGGCGLLDKNGYVESDLIQMTTGIDMKEIEGLAAGIHVIEKDTIDSTIEYIKKQVDQIVNDFELQAIAINR